VADFTNNELSLVVDAKQFLAYETAAEAAAALATGSAGALAALSPDTDRDGFVRAFGRRAFRRPLTPAEEAKYQGVYTKGEALYGAGFAQGASLVIRAMLQSPDFLYRSELGPVGEALNGYDLAAKLSLWLLDTTPSDALLDAAAAGKLDTVDGVESTARQMLEDPRAREVMMNFHAQLYRLDSLASIDKPGAPDFSPALSSELLESSKRFFDDVFVQGQGLREILTSNRAFVGPGLAPLYGITPAPTAIEPRALAASRAGYFLQVPFLQFYGANREPNSIQRGVSVERDLLCAAIAPPPAIVAFPPVDASQTNRQRITTLTATCGMQCHNTYINPLGFAFESFDGLGQERPKDNGLPIDTSGAYPFKEGVKEFADARGLMTILGDSEQAHTCYAKKVTEYALERDIVEPDTELIHALSEVSRTESLKEVIVSLVRDAAFRVRQEGTP
jgi:hypothetical protein